MAADGGGKGNREPALLHRPPPGDGLSCYLQEPVGSRSPWIAPTPDRAQLIGGNIFQSQTTWDRLKGYPVGAGEVCVRSLSFKSP